MKKNAVMTLVKDVLLAAVFFGIAYALIASEGGEGMLGIFVAGLPFGWRWSSKFITAVSMNGLLQKALISVFVGWFAIFIVLIVDVIRIIATPSDRPKANRQGA